MTPFLQRSSKTPDLLPLLLPGQLHAADPTSGYQLCAGAESPGACLGNARRSRCVLQAWYEHLSILMQRHPRRGMQWQLTNTCSVTEWKHAAELEQGSKDMHAEGPVIAPPYLWIHRICEPLLVHSAAVSLLLCMDI